MLGIAGSYVSYRDKVFNFIDSFSCIFYSDVLDTAKGLFTYLPPSECSPSTTAISLIYLSDKINGGSEFKAHFHDVVIKLLDVDRRNRPKFGRKLITNIKNKAEEYEKIVDIEKQLFLNEVIKSGSKIGYKELLQET